MPTTASPLPLSDTLTPESASAVCQIVREAHAGETPVYPLGGGTSLAYGRPATRDGLGLALTGMQRIIDYPARDMTITLEAGVSMQTLRETLQAEQQELPVDVPDSAGATVGGVLATNWNGPRRLGYGPLRDWVIGIESVDGRGTLFHGGGRVVKNVAGYDFCKLLTGSLGTLGVITQVTLKVRPIASAREALTCCIHDWPQAERLLASLTESSLRPVAMNLTASGSDHQLTACFEGSQAEVSWQIETLTELWRTLQVSDVQRLDATASAAHLLQCVDFPAAPDAAVVLKVTVVPSGVTAIASAARAIDPACELLAYAGNGVVFIRFAEEPDDLGKVLQGQLRPLAAKYHGQVALVSRAAGGEMTSQMVWGGLGSSLAWMQRVKEQFDPAGILNPNRFVY